MESFLVRCLLIVIAVLTVSLDTVRAAAEPENASTAPALSYLLGTAALLVAYVLRK